MAQTTRELGGCKGRTVSRERESGDLGPVGVAEGAGVGERGKDVTEQEPVSDQE